MGHFARGGPFGAALQRDGEAGANERKNGRKVFGVNVAQRGVEDAALAVGDRHQHGFIFAGGRGELHFVGERGGEDGDVFRGAAETAVDLVVGVEPRGGEAAHDRVIGSARGDEEVVFRWMRGTAGGGGVEDDLAVAPTDHRAEGNVAGTDRAVGFDAPAADADHLVPLFPVRKRVVGIVDGDEAAAVLHVVDEGGLGGGGPFVALVDHDDGGVAGKIGFEAGHVGALCGGADDVDGEEAGLLEVSFYEGSALLPVVIF